MVMNVYGDSKDKAFWGGFYMNPNTGKLDMETDQRMTPEQYQAFSNLWKSQPGVAPAKIQQMAMAQLGLSQPQVGAASRYYQLQEYNNDPNSYLNSMMGWNSEFKNEAQTGYGGLFDTTGPKAGLTTIEDVFRDYSQLPPDSQAQSQSPVPQKPWRQQYQEAIDAGKNPVLTPFGVVVRDGPSTMNTLSGTPMQGRVMPSTQYQSPQNALRPTNLQGVPFVDGPKWGFGGGNGKSLYDIFKDSQAIHYGGMSVPENLRMTPEQVQRARATMTASAQPAGQLLPSQSPTATALGRSVSPIAQSAPVNTLRPRQANAYEPATSTNTYGRLRQTGY